MNENRDIEKEWEKYQIENSKNIITTDTTDVNKIRYIGGLDISFDKKNNSIGCAYLTIYDIKLHKIVYENHKLCKLDLPYISGFLGFREIPIYTIITDEIKGKTFYPDVLFIDGFGILHPRGFGSASQIGYEFDIKSVGIAKTLMCIDGLDEIKIKSQFRKECHKKGDYIKLIGISNNVYGVALKTSDEAINPLYISVGHKISLESCIALVLSTCQFKNPEPIRNSDIKSKLFL